MCKGRQIRNVLLPGETLNAALVSVLKHVSRSRFGRTIRRLWSFITGNSEEEYPDILQEKNIVEERQLIVQRDELRQQWHDKWQNEGLDFVLTVTFPFPALENGDGEKASLMSASYTFLFNLVHLISPPPSFLKLTDFFAAGLFGGRPSGHECAERP